MRPLPMAQPISHCRLFDFLRRSSFQWHTSFTGGEYLRFPGVRRNAADRYRESTNQNAGASHDDRPLSHLE